MKFLKFQNFTLDAMSDRNNFAEKFSREKGLEFLKFQSFALVSRRKITLGRNFREVSNFQNFKALSFSFDAIQYHNSE